MQYKYSQQQNTYLYKSTIELQVFDFMKINSMKICDLQEATFSLHIWRRQLLYDVRVGWSLSDFLLLFLGCGGCGGGVVICMCGFFFCLGEGFLWWVCLFVGEPRKADLLQQSYSIRSLHFPLNSVKAVSAYQIENTTRGLVMLQIVKPILPFLVCLVLTGAFPLFFLCYLCF